MNTLIGLFDQFCLLQDPEHQLGTQHSVQMSHIDVEHDTVSMPTLVYDSGYLDGVKPGRQGLEAMIRQARLRRTGHVMRCDGNRLLKQIFRGQLTHGPPKYLPKDGRSRLLIATPEDDPSTDAPGACSCPLGKETRGQKRQPEIP